MKKRNRITKLTEEIIVLTALFHNTELDILEKYTILSRLLQEKREERKTLVNVRHQVLNKYFNSI
tara:strand:+ start:2475 stop:2669 length:195 start_codon:yes stop_codon:yes gene_type:complete